MQYIESVQSSAHLKTHKEECIATVSTNLVVVQHQILASNVLRDRPTDDVSEGAKRKHWVVPRFVVQLRPFTGTRYTYGTAHT